MHIPVLLEEVLDALQIRPGGSYMDATVGQGGHAACHPGAIGAERAGFWASTGIPMPLPPPARLSRTSASASIWSTAALPTSPTVAEARGFAQVDGILFDLGYSSTQLEASGRGFSFQRDEPLDMRFDRQGATAADLVNDLPERELADLIYRYGEEPDSRQIARHIVANRPLRTTVQLASLIEGAARGRGKIHPATRTFQALRIAVNDELSDTRDGTPSGC